MKYKKLTTALFAAGALCSTGAIADAHLSYEEGEAPYLEIEEELMVCLYEAMMSIGATAVVAESCQDLEEVGPIPFEAAVRSNNDEGLIVFGEDLNDLMYVSCKYIPNPGSLISRIRGRKYEVLQGDVTTWGAFEQDAPAPHVTVANTTTGRLHQGGVQVRDYNNVVGYPRFTPAFSANSAIFVTNAYMEIGAPGDAGSVYDEHVIKDFYKLTTVEGKCEDVPSGTNHPNCTPEEAFFDWGLEVITKLDYPEYKYRQDSEHIPWNSEDGYWTIKKRLIAAGIDDPTECEVKARGQYSGTASGTGDADYIGTLTFEVTND